MILLALAACNATRMAVTNKRVIVKIGFLRTRTMEMFLSKMGTPQEREFYVRLGR
jgi:Bacterial PH domain